MAYHNTAMPHTVPQDPPRPRVILSATTSAFKARWVIQSTCLQVSCKVSKRLHQNVVSIFFVGVEHAENCVGCPRDESAALNPLLKFAPTSCHSQKKLPCNLESLAAEVRNVMSSQFVRKQTEIAETALAMETKIKDVRSLKPSLSSLHGKGCHCQSTP